MGVITGHGSLDGIKVISVGSHDTASAVAGTPLSSQKIRHISQVAPGH